MTLKARRFVAVGSPLQGDEPVLRAGQVQAATLLQADVVALPLDGPVQLDAVLNGRSCFIDWSFLP